MTQMTENRQNDLKEACQQWMKAELDGDVAVLERLLADDFAGIGAFGFVLSKEQWINRFRAGDLTYTSLVWEDTNYRYYGDAAVVVGIQTHAGAHQDHSVDGAFRATLIGIFEDDNWKIAGVQYSNLAKPPGR